MEELVARIHGCTRCETHLPLGPKPIIQVHPNARILIVGQAPGRKAHDTGIPWNDASGNRLRTWLGMDRETFYDATQVAIVPMGFCYPGKGKTGDLPPMPVCAPQWHPSVLRELPDITLTLLIGQYAQKYYLSDWRSLTESVQAARNEFPSVWPLPHPSPRNQFWIRKHPWFEELIVPQLQLKVQEILGK